MRLYFLKIGGRRQTVHFQFSRVAGKTFAQAASDEGYCNWVAFQNPHRSSPLFLFKQYVFGVSLNKGESVGLTLEVDLEYPTTLHDKHNDYPLAPEPYQVLDNELKQYSNIKLKGKKRLASKLCATLHDKKSMWYIGVHSGSRLKASQKFIGW
eukprot:2279107-Prymnesium_polylepis.1